MWNLVPRPTLGVEGEIAALLVAHHLVGDGQPLAGSLAHFLGGEERVEPAIGRVRGPS
jgi:hypothetical protein